MFELRDNVERGDGDRDRNQGHERGPSPPPTFMSLIMTTLDLK
ncbi:hypothetical protein [Dictyobacter alpinus]|nr:hypothetical protein [Dictyobacter alpinus]